MKKNIVVLIIFFLGFWIVFQGLQNKSVYDNTFGKLYNNWVNINGNRMLADVPYISLKNENYSNWDAYSYNYVRENGYYNNPFGERIFAFFPMFPYIWRFLHIPPVGILFYNFILFGISLLILIKLFSDKKYNENLLILLSLPSTIIFFIPYTEATFLFFITIGIYGFIKDKYWILFMGLFLASMTKPTYIFLFLSIVGTEAFFLMGHKRYLETIKNTFLRIAPLFAGALAVSLLQLRQGSGSLIKFIEVQKYWDHKFSIPHNLRDWSHEGFGINMGVIFIIAIPFFVFVFQKYYKQIIGFFKVEKNTQIVSKNEYLMVLSMLYTSGLALFIIFFQGGSLHNLFRYTITSPFFFILFLMAFNKIKDFKLNFRFFIISLLSLQSIFMVSFANCSGIWNFSDFGLILLIAASYFWVFQDFSSNIFYKIGLYLTCFMNIVWTTYLFNMYLSNGWIFA
ncbi:MAG: hypothetical protein A2W91_04560 [Bacteroidetes bacterium GWF2_38_335]|nr:MAG: hypothetical protein A2W91_04560 [Bacteroidetes bacterium GWF2_38_335]HBS88220.1 hypothetical protein [Bacteroidales bacterium]